MKVAEWLNNAASKLAHVDAPRLEAQVLLAHAMSVERVWLLAHPDEDAPVLADVLLSRRMTDEPLAYILGYRAFFGRRFAVGPGVLIPRQETEVLIDAAIEAIDEGSESVLDLGCGSGAIGITLSLERPNAYVTCSDISEAAVKCTRQNAQNLTAGVRVVHSNLFEAVPDRFDLIVCNPPYIGRDEVLSNEVRQFEPEEALFSGEFGLDFHEELAKQVDDHLCENGRLLIEIGYEQAQSVQSLFRRQGWALELSRSDLLGHVRVLGFRPALP